YPFNKLYQNGHAPIQPANPDLKWETDYQPDFGIDAAILNGDITFTADWFRRRSKDFLLQLAAPAQSGYNTLTRNVGSRVNTGLEFAVNYNHNKSGAFKWSAGITLTAIKNKLTSITSGTKFVTN